MAVNTTKKNQSKSHKNKMILKDPSESSSSEEIPYRNNEEDSNDDSGDDVSDSSDWDNTKGFTDENSEWLKLKNKSQLLGDGSSDDDEENEFADVDEYSDDEEGMLEIERESKLLDKEMENQQHEAEQEMRRTIADNSFIFHLPTADELEDEQNGTRVVPPSELKERINDILTVLGDFKSRKESDRSRSEYISQLASDMSEVFGYLPELVEYFLTMFNPSETLEFLEASDSPRPLVIRTNTLKTRRKDLAASLLKRGVTLDPLANWSKVGLKITASPIPIGATPEYLSGQYMLQSAASFCPVLALNPIPGKEIVLDMSAAPGGKTSYLAQLMRNTGTIIANDLKPERQKATVANMHRLGVKNVITCCYDGRKLGKIWRNRFTKILLDAPCSGLGVISRDPSVKVQRTIKDIQRCGVLQKELLLNAIDCLNCKGKDGGIMVYSTCSISVTENEDVVNYILSKRDVKIVDTGLDFGTPGFTRYQNKRYHPSLALTRRFYPHVHNMDGFYVAKLQKLSDRRPENQGDFNLQGTTTDGEVQVDDEVNWEDEVKKAVSSSGNKTVSLEKLEITKKRENNGENTPQNEEVVKKRKISEPPKSLKQKRVSTNASVTKPRRRVTQTDMQM